MLIIDASVWIDLLYGMDTRQTLWLRHAVKHQEVGLTSLTLCEVLQGVRGDAKFRKFEKDLRRFSVLDSCSAELAVEAARNYRLLRKLGITVRSTIDCIVATYCIRHGHQLLHNDRDYTPFVAHLGLLAIDPPAVPLN
jgi:predicted nucleic acid-binding protein